MPYIFTYYNPNHTIRFQHPLATERCIGTSKSNLQCRRIISIGINRCFQHMPDLKIKNSTIDNAGKGLFAYNRNRPNDAILFKSNEKIVDYLGDTIDNNELNHRYGNDTAPYALKINNNLYIDPATRRGIGSLANKPDAHNPNPLLRQPNAKFSVNTRYHTASLKATKNIRNHQEILTSYGHNYVIQDNYTTKYRRRR